MLRLACSDLLGYCPFGIAEELGYWRGVVDVSVTRRVHSHVRDGLFARGEVDLKTTSLHSFIGGQGPGRIVAVLATVRRPGIDRVVVGPKCPDVGSLSSARIVYLPGALEHLYLYYFLKHLGVPWPPPERRIEVTDRRTMLDLFWRGEADVCVTYGRNLARLDRAPNRVLLDLPYDAPIFATTLAASDDVLLAQRAQVAHLLMGYFRAVDSLAGREGPDRQRKAQLAVLRHYEGPWADLAAELDQYRLLTQVESRSLIRGTASPSLHQRILDCAHTWQELGVIGSFRDPAGLVEDILDGADGAAPM